MLYATVEVTWQVRMVGCLDSIIAFSGAITCGGGSVGKEQNNSHYILVDKQISNEIIS